MTDPILYLTTDQELTSVADAIRTKGGTSAALEYPTEFVSAIGAIQTGTPKAAQTYYPSTSDQTIASGYRLTGTQTFKGVLLTNLTAGNIKKDVVVKVGDSADDDRITSVTGTYEGGGGGTGLVYETGTYTPAEDIIAPTISFATTHDTTPIYVIMEDMSNAYSDTLNTMYTFGFVDWEKVFGVPIYRSTSVKEYGLIFYVYRGTSTTTFSSSSPRKIQPSSLPAQDINYLSYYVSPSQFRPEPNGSYYYRSGRTYKWFAVWGPTT